MDEIWKEIPGYNGMYMASNLGRVKSLNYMKTGSEQVMATQRMGDWHLTVSMPDMPRLVHVLVAKAFIPNPENKPIVHHIDGNPINNVVDNLMWVTHKEHQEIHVAKPVYKYNLDGMFIAAYPSITEAAIQNGHKTSGTISQCCLGNIKTAYGFQWSFEYKDRLEPVKTKYQRCSESMTNGKLSKKVGQYSIDGKLIKVWPSMSEASRQMNISVPDIVRCCRGRRKTRKGFVWKYV